MVISLLKFHVLATAAKAVGDENLHIIYFPQMTMSHNDLI